MEKEPTYRENVKPLKQEKYAVFLNWVDKANTFNSILYIIKADDRFAALEEGKILAKKEKGGVDHFWYEKVVGISQLENNE